MVLDDLVELDLVKRILKDKGRIIDCLDPIELAEITFNCGVIWPIYVGGALYKGPEEHVIVYSRALNDFGRLDSPQELPFGAIKEYKFVKKFS